jgi:hypothetical protein
MSVPREALAAYLEGLAAADAVVTYAEAARDLSLGPPHRIHRLTMALEASMAEDAAAGRPFRAARIVSRARDGLPAPGFFAAARRLGRYAGPDDGPEAAAFLAAERSG